MDLNKVYSRALSLLGRREYSVLELRGKLRRKFTNLSVECIDQVLVSLQEEGFLSNERFAETLIRSRIDRGYGPFYISRELNRKGIDGGLAERLLDEAAMDWLELARRQMEKHHGAPFEDRAAWSKTARFLQRRGFDGALVMKVLGEPPTFSGSESAVPGK